MIGLSLSSCGEVPFSRIYGNSDAEGNVKWESGSARSSALESAVSPRSAAPASTHQDVSLQASVPEYDAYYASLGTKKHTYTPERFKLWSWTVISNPEEYVELAMYWDECDYAAADSVTEPQRIEGGFYDVLFITVANADGNHAHGGRPFVPRNSIVVSMPDYAGGVFADEAHPDGINMNVEFLGGDKYHFSWIEVMPQPPGLRDINFIIFGPFENQRLYVADSYDTAQFTGNEYYGSSGTNQYSILIPWGGVVVGPRDVQFRVSLDLTDIIEVYEGPTGADDDDVVLLANRFWDRFSLEVVEQ
jgi:hypothetical protein